MIFFNQRKEIYCKCDLQFKNKQFSLEAQFYKLVITKEKKKTRLNINKIRPMQ